MRIFLFTIAFFFTSLPSFSQSIDLGGRIGTTIPTGELSSAFLNPGFSYDIHGNYNISDLSFGLIYSYSSFRVEDLGFLTNSENISLNTFNVVGYYNLVNEELYQLGLGLGAGISNDGISSNFSSGVRAKGSYFISETIGLSGEVPIIFTEGTDWLGIRIGVFYRINKI